MYGREEGEDIEPEPEEQVDLLVDDVQAEDAEAVELLFSGRRAHAVERAAGSKDIYVVNRCQMSLEIPTTTFFSRAYN